MIGFHARETVDDSDQRDRRALGVLFMLTALALRAAGLLRHPLRVAAALAMTLAVRNLVKSF